MSRKEKVVVEKPMEFGNAFADLKVENLPPPPDAKPPVKPERPLSPEEKKVAALSPEDRELLKAFGGAENVIQYDGHQKKLPKITMNIERKGHHGKTVTLVHGLKELPMEEQMALCSFVKARLGVGARFLDGVLEVQGDQRGRLEKVGVGVGQVGGRTE